MDVTARLLFFCCLWYFCFVVALWLVIFFVCFSCGMTWVSFCLLVSGLICDFILRLFVWGMICICVCVCVCVFCAFVCGKMRVFVVFLSVAWYVLFCFCFVVSWSAFCGVICIFLVLVFVVGFVFCFVFWWYTHLYVPIWIKIKPHLKFIMNHILYITVYSCYIYCACWV